MGAPASEVSYTSATTRKGDHEVYMDGHGGVLEKNNIFTANYVINQNRNTDHTSKDSTTE
jgi:hypothetical protein